MAKRLGRFSFFIQAHAIVFLLRGSWVGKLAKVCVPKLVSPSPAPISPTSHDRRRSANNSIAATKVSRLAGSTGAACRFCTGDWTVVNLVSCRWLAPHVPCPVPRPVSVPRSAQSSRAPAHAEVPRSTEIYPAPPSLHLLLIPLRFSPRPATDSRPLRFPQTHCCCPGPRSLGRRETARNIVQFEGSANAAGYLVSILANEEICLGPLSVPRTENCMGGPDPAPRSNWWS